MAYFNFLPKVYKDGFKKEIMARILYAASAVILGWTLVFGITMFSAVKFLSIQNESLENNIRSLEDQRETEEANELEDQINDVNTVLRRISDIRQENPRNVLQVLVHVASLIPDGARIQSLSFTPESERILITGRSDSRITVRSLEESLKDDDAFADVEHPLSNLIQTSSGDFEFKFTMTLASEDGEDK